jgi:hypothetical protein
MDSVDLCPQCGQVSVEISKVMLVRPRLRKEKLKPAWVNLATTILMAEAASLKLRGSQLRNCRKIK